MRPPQQSTAISSRRRRSQLGEDNGFMVAFLPVGLAAFGALTLMDEDRDGLAKLVIGVGGVGALAVMLSNVYAVWYLLQHPEHGDRGLITLGIVIGTVAMTWYLRMATRVLRTAPPSPG